MRNSTTIVVHADAAWRSAMAALLDGAGGTSVTAARWTDIEHQFDPRLARSMVVQLARDGRGERLATFARLRRALPDSRAVALLPANQMKLSRGAFLLGAWDCLEEPVTPQAVFRCLFQSARPNRLRMRRAPVTVDRVDGWLSEVREHVRNLHLESTRALVAAVEARDPYTRAHSATVARYAVCIGRRLGLPQPQLAVIRLAGLLHDVGKIGVPDAILTKPGPLTAQEFEVVKCHPQTAVEILSSVSVMIEERRIILHHHERYDGNGYPNGLAGDQIPMGARILAVADALDTMLSPRTYKLPYDWRRVRQELVRGAGRQFDPEIVAAALGWLDDENADHRTPNGLAAASS